MVLFLTACSEANGATTGGHAAPAKAAGSLRCSQRGQRRESFVEEVEVVGVGVGVWGWGGGASRVEVGAGRISGAVVVVVAAVVVLVMYRRWS